MRSSKRDPQSWGRRVACTNSAPGPTRIFIEKADDAKTAAELAGLEQEYSAVIDVALRQSIVRAQKRGTKIIASTERGFVSMSTSEYKDLMRIHRGIIAAKGMPPTAVIDADFWKSCDGIT